MCVKINEGFCERFVVLSIKLNPVRGGAGWFLKGRKEGQWHAKTQKGNKLSLLIITNEVDGREWAPNKATKRRQRGLKQPDVDPKRFSIYN